MPAIPPEPAPPPERQSHQVREVAESFGADAGRYDRARPSYPRVLGVDPDARMAEAARASGVEAEVAKFEDWDPAGRAFDVAAAGQAWHWVDPVAGAAKAARVLRPGGRLALFWNAFQPPPGLNEAFAEVYARVVPGPSGWMSCPPSAVTPGSRRTRSGNCWPGSAPPSTR